MTAALAGRRVDAPGATRARFPLWKVDRVREELDDLFVRERVDDVVCSAACGADLIALSVAARRDLNAHIVLPFEPATFLKTSVVDRPGEWEETYWMEIKRAQEAGHLTVLDGQPERDASYAAATKEIIGISRNLAQGVVPLAIAVWEGATRGAGDATADFIGLASSNGFRVVEVTTR